VLPEHHLAALQQRQRLVPSGKREPILSVKTAPLVPAGVVGSERRARVAQLGALVSARSEIGQE
jgi:hypothetical protein